jgi:hypothetical protein
MYLVPEMAGLRLKIIGEKSKKYILMMSCNVTVIYLGFRSCNMLTPSLNHLGTVSTN